MSSEIAEGIVSGLWTRRLGRSRREPSSGRWPCGSCRSCFCLYIVNIVDRMNVGFAKLRMLEDLGLDERSTVSAPACSTSDTCSSRCPAT